jgi:hypothetical protein
VLSKHLLRNNHQKIEGKSAICYMRLMAKLALCASLPWVVGGMGLVSAQTPSRADGTMLLSPEQGQALVDFALDHDRWSGRKPDCSHLVHKIYNQAGLHYPYAESRRLYHGSASFERVSRPQPGDLIVWLGHVGIVVSPRQRTFFSSVSSGIITEDWTIDAWRARGRPRFFRYRIGPATDLTLLADLVAPRPDGDDVLASARTPDSANPGSGRGDEELSRTEPARAVIRSEHSDDELDAPSVVAILHQRAKPDKEDFAAAIRQGAGARAKKLMAGTRLDLSRPVSVFESIEVKKIKIKHENGSITLKVKESLSLVDGKIIVGRTAELKLGLRRRNGGWVISDPQQRLLLPQDQAVGVFERQADLFLQQTPGGKGTRIVVKALAILFDREPAGPERAAIQ